MNVTVITVLKDGTHLEHWEEIDGDSIEVAAESVVGPHVADRLEFYGENVARLIVIAAELSWSINPALGQDLMYRPALQSIAKQRIDVTAQAGGQVIARTSVESGEQAAAWIDGTLRKHGSALASDVFGPARKENGK